MSKFLPTLVTVVSAALLVCNAEVPAVPDWALPGSPTHKQVPPPPDFHRAPVNFYTPIGVFEGQSDIGGPLVPGSASFDAGTKRYTINSAGYNIWYNRDEFRFLWKKMSGDVSLAGDITFPTATGIGDRKMVLIFRQSLDDDSPEAMAGIHGGGLVHLICRPETNALLQTAYQLKATIVPAGKTAGRLGIEKRGDSFTLFFSQNGEPMQAVGKTVALHLKEPFYVGIGFCSHHPVETNTGIAENVLLESGAGRVTQIVAGAISQKRFRSQLTIIGIDGTGERVIYETADKIEAPNWSPDGKWLVFNSKNKFFRIAADGSTQPEVIPTGDVKGINNDHVLSPDGKTLYFSAGGHLYAVPFAGGQPRRISNRQAPERKFLYYLHGVSPDEKTLAYVGVEAGNKYELYTIPAAGGPDAPLTQLGVPSDGPEYSSDGQWIYFNSERDAKVPGHAQCYRMKPDGTGIEQLTHDERVNWFPHISPDEKWIVYISFPPGTTGHPANKDVILRRMKPDGSEQADIIAFNGGQGTINVNSWSPDNKHFAFVSYKAVNP